MSVTCLRENIRADHPHPYSFNTRDDGANRIFRISARSRKNLSATTFAIILKTKACRRSFEDIKQVAAKL